MLKAKLAAIVGFCTRRAWSVILLSGLMTFGAAEYAARHFAIDTDVNKLISPDLPWRQQELAFSDAFPQRNSTIFAVVDAPTAELASEASTTLAKQLHERSELFEAVDEPQDSPLFVRNGLLFLPADELDHSLDALTQAQPLLKALATDPSLRGLQQVLSLGLTGVQVGRLTLDAMAHTLSMAATTLDNVLAGRPASFSWQEMMRGVPPQPGDLRRYIQIRPVLDFASLQPGEKATQAIRQAVADLALGARYQARVRLTGPVAIQDEEFATLREGALPNTIGTVLVVLTILWLALKSPKIIFAVFVGIFAGLVITAALGLWLVGPLNPISIAFAVLFVGIGVDFGIQFSVRYRAERYEIDDLSTALVNTARNVGVPLTLAAATTAAGFFSFLPTAYGGFSALGEIAGIGMIIAYLTSITLLPALLKVLNPPGEKEPLGFRALAPIDHFTERHRIAILVITAVLVIGGLPLLYFLPFDFNPMNLRSPKAESIATYLDLRRDPATGASAIDILAPSLATAQAMAERVSKVPEVSRVITLASFVPADQEPKLAAISKAAKVIEPVLAEPPQPPASDADNVMALQVGADALLETAGEEIGPGADAARHLAGAMTQLAKATPEMRAQAQAAFVTPLATALDSLRNLLRAEPVTAETVPADFAGDWIKPDGSARVQSFRAAIRTTTRCCGSLRAPSSRSSRPQAGARSRSWNWAAP